MARDRLHKGQSVACHSDVKLLTIDTISFDITAGTGDSCLLD
jgi:hypothetical protein